MHPQPAGGERDLPTQNDPIEGPHHGVAVERQYER